MKKKTYQRSVICVGAVCGLLAGCQSSVQDQSRIRPDLQVIEAVKLSDQSTTPPVEVAEATEKLLQTMAEPNEVPVTEVFLTLEQVRVATLANNLDLKVDLVDPDMAQLGLDAERAKFEAVFSGSATTDYSEVVGTGSVSKAWSSQIGVSKPLATGGTVQASLPVSDYDPGGLAAARASVSVIQSLLRGAGSDLNTQSIRIAEHQWQMVSARTKLNAIAWLANADVAYWRLYAAYKDLAVRHEQYKLAQDQLSHARKKVTAGSAARIEIVRAEAGLASRLESVINAETTVEYYARNLRRMMNLPNLPLESSVSMVLKTEPYPLGLTLDEQALFAQAVANRMDMVELEMSMEIDDLNVAYARNATLPDVTLSYAYAARTQGVTAGHALGHFSGQAYDDHVVGLSAVIPIGNQVARAQLQRAKLSKFQGELLRKRLRQRIQQEVAEAVSDLDRNWRRILAAEQGALAAQRDYQVDQSQFNLGRSNSTSVLYSAERLGEAQLGRIRAFVDYEIAQINLARVTGTLLGKDRILLTDMSAK